MTDLRKAVACDFDKVAERNPDAWAAELRERNRVIDWWLTFDMRRAAQTLHLSRYRDSPDVSAAIINLRYALKKLEAAMHEHMKERSLE